MREDGLLITGLSGARLSTAQGARAHKLLLRDGDSFYAGSVRLSLVLIDASGRAGDYAHEDDLFDTPREDRRDIGASLDAPREQLWQADDLFDTGGDADEDDF